LTRLPVLALLLAAALVAGCNGGTTPTSAPTTPTTSSSTVSANGTTTPGTVVRLGQRAVVQWRGQRGHQSRAAVTVTAVKRGSIRDLKQFQLTRPARSSTVYYVSAAVRNLGPGNLSGRFLTLYGKVSARLVVQPVRFTLAFKRCDYQPLPAHFTKGKRARVCMVMLAPRHGRISSIEWRSSGRQLPVSWRAR
jgi:hypothetical protein